MNKKTKILLGSFAGVATLGGVATGLGVALSQQNNTTINSLTHEDKEIPVKDQNTSSSQDQNSSSSTTTNEENVNNVENNVVDSTTTTEENVNDVENNVVENDYVGGFDNLGEGVSAFSMRATFDQETDEYTLKIENGDSLEGKVRFLTKEDAEAAIEKQSADKGFKTQITAKPGDTIYVAAVANVGYTLKNLKVYGANPNIMLGVVSMLQTENSGVYAFTIPNDDEDSENAFQPDVKNPLIEVLNKGVIHVVASFTKSQVASWAYNFNYRSYVLDLEKDTILDDSNPNLNLINLDQFEDIGVKHDDTINFIIFLNGHNLSVGTFTIPHGVTLTLINNRTNTGKATIELAKDKISDHGNKGFVVGGVLAQYSSVEVVAPIRSDNDFNVIQPR